MPDDLENHPESHLLSHYDSPVPPDFAATLQKRLHAELPRQARTRHWWAIGTAAAAAIALAALAARHWAATPAPVPATPSPGQPRLAQASPNLGLQSPPAPNVAALGDIPLEAQLSRGSMISYATMIVQARIVGWDDSHVFYAVERTIYGTPPADKTLTLDAIYSSGGMRKNLLDEARRRFVAQENREPTDDEVFSAMLKDNFIEMDNRVVLLLQPRPAGGFMSMGSFFDVPPGHPLEDTVQDIVKVIRDGSYLEVQATQGLGDIFADQLRRSDTIVRAKLTAVDDNAAHWQVEKTLKGKAITTPLDIPHDQFRLRAQTIVEQAALKDETLKDPAKRETRIAEETKALTKAELLPGHEAILFLTKVQPAATTTRADVLYRVYDTSPRVKLDALEQLIASPQDVKTNL